MLFDIQRNKKVGFKES